MNTLQQGGNPSNHDVLLDCGKKKYLVEMKFTEHGDAPCGSSKRDEECLKRMSELHCPLETNYGTRYYPFLRGTDSPYDIDKLGSQYPDCPFMHGEQYQIMRYILLCHARSVSSEIWTSVIIFPRKNQFMDEEIKLTMNCLKDSTTLKRIYLEDAVGIMRNFNEGYADWLSERYII